MDGFVQVGRRQGGMKRYVAGPDFREGRYETSPPTISASGRGRGRAAGRLADRRRVASPTAIASFKKSAYSEIFVVRVQHFYTNGDSNDRRTFDAMLRRLRIDYNRSCPTRHPAGIRRRLSPILRQCTGFG